MSVTDSNIKVCPKGKGEMDYDFKNDILFFKTSEREYSKSVELDSIVLDIDKDGFIVGIQIFDASAFLNVEKATLQNIPKWAFEATVEEDRLEVRLDFQVQSRNKTIQKNPIIIQQLSEHLPNSHIECAA